MRTKYFSTILFLSLLFFPYRIFAQDQQLPSKIEVTDKEDKNNPQKGSIAETIKDWLIPVSTFITLLTVSIGTYQSLKEYRLKLKAEIRLSQSAEVDMDIKLMQGFTQLLALAHARKGNYLSEKTVEKMFEKELFTEEELHNPNKLNRKIEQVAILNIYSGVAEQDAFVAAITNLGLKHEILRTPVIQALETMMTFIPNTAEKYLNRIKNES